MTLALIELKQVGFTYPGVVPVVALTPTTLRIGRGERVAIVGPSGSGKSTLLQLLGLLSNPTEGSYWLAGYDTGLLSEAQRCDLRGSQIGFVFQSFHLIDHRDVAANVELPLRYSPTSRSGSERMSLVSDALERVGLLHRANHRCDELSGGERQRVAIARAMVGRPSIILADEPTGNLDSTSSSQIIDYLLTSGPDGSTLVVITHDPEVASRFPRTLMIRDGHVTDVASSPTTTRIGPSDDGA